MVIIIVIVLVDIYVKFIEDNKGNLDDLKFERLPYINKTAAEVKELYLKEHNIE